MLPSVWEQMLISSLERLEGTGCHMEEKRYCSSRLGPAEGVLAALATQPGSLELGTREGPQVQSEFPLHFNNSRGASYISFFFF